MQKLLTFPVVLAFLALPAAAQMPWDTGPYQVGLRAHVYYTPKASGPFGAVYGRSFYPALGTGLDAAPDLANGPYPHIAFLHGHTIDSTHYVIALRQLASWGFVVTAVDTNVGFLEPAVNSELADDQLLLMNFVEGEDMPGGFFEGVFDGGDWAVVGHSMGAGAAFFFADVAAPRCRVINSHQPYLGTMFGGTEPMQTAIDNFTGSLSVIAATEDTLTPWDTMCLPWYQAAISAKRRLFPVVQGMGHLGMVDVIQDGDTMPGLEQDRITYLWMTGFLLAEMYGEQKQWDLLFGEASSVEPWTLESGGWEPAFWTQASTTQPGDLSLAIAGNYGELALVGIAGAPASIASPWGTIGISLVTSSVLFVGNLDTSTGTDLSFVPIQPGSSGLTFYLQALQLFPGGFGALSVTIPFTAP